MTIITTPKIIDIALAEYHKGITPEFTIRNCSDTELFQFIISADSDSTGVYQFVRGKKQLVKYKQNKVYATNIEGYGNLYYFNDKDGTETEFEGIPKHCLIDNNDYIELRQIDKHYYVDEVYKIINGAEQINSEEESLSNDIWEILGGI